MATCRTLTFAALLLTSGCRSADCAEGLVLMAGHCNPPEGTCGECGDHEFCDTRLVPNVCACVAGYEGEPCAFTALIADPGFQQEVDTGAWENEESKGATVERFAPGDLDMGEGALDSGVICNAGSLLQVVEMPSYDRAEPLVVEVNYRAEGVHGLAVGFGRAWRRLPPTGPTWRSEAFCLGEGGYGDPPSGDEVKVRISASERLANCYDSEPGSSIRIDHFTIRQAADMECLRPGGVLNGTAELSGDEWGFFTEADAKAGFVPGEGRDGTPGASVSRGAGETGRATMTTQISVPVPSTTPSPALVFWWRGKSGALFDVDLGTRVSFDDRGRRVDTLIGSGSGPDYIYCLPPWTHGNVLDLSFSLPDETTEAVNLAVDDVRIITDTACGDDKDLLDPGFESAPNRWLGASVGSGLDVVLLTEDEGLAHSGTGLLELHHENAEADLAMETYVLVPPSEGKEGPVATFWSKSPATISSEVQWALGRSEVETGTVETEASWQQNEVCLPRHWAGRWFRLQVRVGSPDGLFDVERVLLDDFALGASLSCPTE